MVPQENPWNSWNAGGTARCFGIFHSRTFHGNSDDTQFAVSFWMRNSATTSYHILLIITDLSCFIQFFLHSFAGDSVTTLARHRFPPGGGKRCRPVPRKAVTWLGVIKFLEILSINRPTIGDHPNICIDVYRWL